MTVKEYLQQGYRLARGIRFKRERIKDLRELAGRSTSTYTAEHVSGTPQRSKLENCMCQIDEWEREIDADLRKLWEVRRFISQVSNLDYRRLLELRYEDGLGWDQIAGKMHYSKRHILRLHGNALKHVIECHHLDMVL